MAPGIAKWKRLIISDVTAPGQIQAVAAKKHVTVFRRKPGAPGAGRPEVKAAFTACAHETGGEPIRANRTAKMKTCMEGKGLRTGVCYRPSRSKYAPLAGKKYKLACGPGMVARVTAATPVA